VFLGKWRDLDVAIKKVKASAGVKQTVIDQFRQESDVFSKLRHPKIVMFLGGCSHPKGSGIEYCLVMEYVRGHSIAKILEETKRPFSLPNFIKYARDVSQGMNYLHLNTPQVVHRDLKCLNLMLDEESDSIKIVDFGLSKLKNDVALTASAPRGSLFYMAPELIIKPMGAEYSEKIDVYSFGIVMFEMITGQYPSYGEGVDVLGIVRRVAMEGFRPQFPAGCAAQKGVRELIGLCWEQIASNRPSFAQILDLLDLIEKDPDQSLPKIVAQPAMPVHSSSSPGIGSGTGASSSSATSTTTSTTTTTTTTGSGGRQ